MSSHPQAGHVAEPDSIVVPHRRHSSNVVSRRPKRAFFTASRIVGGEEPESERLDLRMTHTAVGTQFVILRLR